MGLVPKSSLFLPTKAWNKSTYQAETNGTLTTSTSESGIQGEELVITSKKPEGMANFNRGSTSIHLVPKSLFDNLPLKYAGHLRNSWQGAKPGPVVYSLFDKLKRKNKNPTVEYSKEQWNPTVGSPHSTSFSDLCKAGKLSVNCNRSYAACLPKQAGRSQGNTKLKVGCYGKQAKMCIQDLKVVPNLFCIGVKDVTCCRTDGGTSDPLLPVEVHMLPSGGDEESSDAAKIGSERGLTTLPKLDLPWKIHPSNSAILSSSDPHPPQVQSADDPNVIINKSEQHSPVSVLEQLFEDASPRPANAAIKPVKQPIQPLHINFEERSPMKRLKLHSDTISKTSIPSKKQTSSATEYTRKVLEASKLDWHELALKWHSSTQILDPDTYTKIESQSQKVTILESRLLFDHINEVLLNIYQPYCGFYPWVSLCRPHKPHIVTKRNFMEQVIKIVEMNFILGQQELPMQRLVVNAMEKSGAWIDIRSELEDMVLEIVEEAAEELVEEFVFELWLDC
ncbi:hypothetical protein QQ045_022327 [Rhodiola kirilowii]